jgi:hypothetical protein
MPIRIFQAQDYSFTSLEMAHRPGIRADSKALPSIFSKEEAYMCGALSGGLCSQDA